MQESKLETADTQTMNGETNSQRAVEEDFDDGIATMASSKVSHCRSFHSAEDDLRTTGLSKASDRSAYYSTSETIRDNESGSWSNQEEETDDVSVPFDEASMLPFAYGDNNSTLYSIADCSEDPHDRHSLFDVEEAVARANRPKSAQILKPTSKHAGPRGNKQSATPPMPRQMKTTPPVPPVPPSRDNPSKSASRRVPSKSQKRCTGIIIGLFIFASLALIGLASVLYFYFLRESSSPQPVNQGSGFPAQDPLDEFDYNDFNPNTEFSPSPNTSFPTTAPIVIPTASPTIPATRPPTVSGSAALTQFLAANFSIDFPDDPSAPANQAVGWLVEESSGMNTSLMIGGDKLAQRFALMVLELNWREPTNTSLVEPLVHECQWEGVVCNGKRVTELQWGSQELSGTIPLEIGLLTNLQHLDLSKNALEGSIPDNLYFLTKLETLYLYQNQLSGTLSDELGNLKNLTHIHLSHNQLSGSIPLTMRSSTSFIRPYSYINLYSNNFSGSLPEGLGWQNLFYLDLGRNSFAGTLPQDMDNYIALRHLHLDHNQFNGTIPDVLPYVGSDRLEQLSLDHNDFTGEFPGAWSFSWYMVALTLNNNSLTAPLPSDVCDMNVFEGGAMVEMGADCDVCVCSYPFCQSC